MRNLTKTLLPFLFVFSLLFTISCEKSEDTSPENITEKTVVINESEIVSYSSNTIVITGTQTDIQVNDIMVSGANSNAPRGFLRKVSSIQNQNNEITIQTTDATIIEALENSMEDGETSQASFSHTFSENDISGKGLKGSKQVSDLLDPISIPIDAEMGSGDSKITIKGLLTITPIIEGELRFSNKGVAKIDKVLFKAGVESQFELDINSTLKESFIREFPSEPYELEGPTFNMVIGGVYVAVTPVFKLQIGIESSLNGDLSYHYDYGSTLIAGFMYSDDEWKFPSDNGYNVISENSDFNVDLQGHVKVYVMPEVELYFYDKDFVSTGFILEPYAKFESSLNTNQYNWQLTGGLDHEAYFDAKLWGFSPFESQHWNNFIDIPEWEIASGVSEFYTKEKLLGKWQLNELTEKSIAQDLNDCQKQIIWEFFENMKLPFISFDGDYDNNGNCEYSDELLVNWELNGETLRLFEGGAELTIKVLELTKSTLKIEFLDGQGEVGGATLLKV